MRQVHRAGEKCFVDYAGQKPRLVDPATGEVVEVELFVAALGASNYTYAEATLTQQVPDWIASEQGYRSCLGLLRLSRRAGAARLEAACARDHRKIISPIFGQ